MANQKDNTFRLLWMLGAVTTVPFILASGPVAGYLISKYILVNQMGMPQVLVPVFTVLGFVGSGVQVFRIIQRIKQSESNHSK